MGRFVVAASNPKNVLWRRLGARGTYGGIDKHPGLQRRPGSARHCGHHRPARETLGIEPEHARHLYSLGVSDAVPETIEASFSFPRPRSCRLAWLPDRVIASIHKERDKIRAELQKACTAAGLATTHAIRAKTQSPHKSIWHACRRLRPASGSLLIELGTAGAEPLGFLDVIGSSRRWCER